METVIAWLILLAAGAVVSFYAYRYREPIWEGVQGLLMGIGLILVIMLILWALATVIVSD